MHHLSGAIELVSVWSFWGDLSLFEITRASVFFPEKLDTVLTYLPSDATSFLSGATHVNFRKISVPKTI